MFCHEATVPHAWHLPRRHHGGDVHLRGAEGPRHDVRGHRDRDLPLQGRADRRDDGDVRPECGAVGPPGDLLRTRRLRGDREPARRARAVREALRGPRDPPVAAGPRVGHRVRADVGRLRARVPRRHADAGQRCGRARGVRVGADAPHG
jgi:hypothetical protein